MVSFMEMLLILKNFRENAIKLRRKIKSFRYQPWGPSDNANYGELQRWLSAVSPVLHRISLQAISCPANFHSCPLAAAASSVLPSLRLGLVFCVHVALVNILPQNRLTLHSSLSVAVSL